MSRTSNLRAEILKMPELEKAEAAAWIACRGGIGWMFEQMAARGWVKPDEHDPALWKPVPRKSAGPGGAQPLALTVQEVASVVADGKTKTAEIVAECAARWTVSRRTTMTRLREAVDGGLLERTTPAGSYRLPAAEDID